ncbi:head GIN domain-containing protein [Aquimarina longa]|uniref:head GIN domain-containing protein n=1 Tax=Aquimarina longa TaxID=1080221 RepID=UPI000780EC9F|nr:head GIN domain-containing protein [Aquimarina longa]
MNKITLLFIFFIVITVQAQDTITRDIGDFTELKVFDKIRVTLIKGDDNRVEITGIKRRDVDIIQKNNLLKIRMSIGNLWDNNNTEVIVYYTDIHKIDVNEGARVEVTSTIDSKNLDLRAQEGASMIATIETEFLYTKAVTGGEIILKGNAKEQDISITSGGQYHAKNLKSKKTMVKVSAGGTAEVYAKNYIKANTNAGGTIKIYGNPREIDSQKLLGGKIIEVN